MSTQQPEALRLAELLTAAEWPAHMTLVSYARECVAELRRLHAEVQNAHARIESLQAAVIRAESQAERYANPRLIALRDELRDALIDIAEAGAEAWGEDRPCVRIALEAIAKAEGREA